jgi:DNA-binding NarL/FixJ family response regulator
MSKSPINIVLVDDHTIVRDGLKYLLEDEDYIKIIGEGDNGLEAIELVEKLQPDLLIIDIRMPEMNGIEALKILNKTPRKTKSIVLSMHDSEEYILQSIEANAMGYLLKDAGKTEILKAINNVYNGEKYFSGDISNVLINNLLKNKDSHPQEKIELTFSSQNKFDLTKKEIEILRHILEGHTNKTIADLLNKSQRTIETHRFNLMKKMNVKNLLELASLAREHNLL